MNIITALKRRKDWEYIRRTGRTNVIYSIVSNGEFSCRRICNENSKSYWTSYISGPSSYDLLEDDWEILKKLPELTTSGFIK